LKQQGDPKYNENREKLLQLLASQEIPAGKLLNLFSKALDEIQTIDRELNLARQC
jgi:hypothetical protein